MMAVFPYYVVRHTNPSFFFTGGLQDFRSPRDTKYKDDLLFARAVYRTVIPLKCQACTTVLQVLRGSSFSFYLLMQLVAIIYDV